MLIPTRIPSVLLLGATLLTAACSGGSGSASGQQTGGALLLSVTTTSAQTANVLLPTAGTGSLDVANAWFHVGRVELTLETTDSTTPSVDDDKPEHHGQHGSHALHSEHGDDDNDDDDDHGGNDDDHGAEDHDDDTGTKTSTLVVDGPFTFDVAAGPTVIESVPVQPGTIRSARLGLQTTGAAPFDGDSIVLEGTYKAENGDQTRFTLRSKFAGNLQVPVANGGIVIDANTVVPVELAFDLASLVAALDFDAATVEDGFIRIDETHNADLLMVFAMGLHSCVGAHERDD